MLIFLGIENREAFRKRLLENFSVTERGKIHIAYILAKNCHRAQKRKEKDSDGNPLRYFEHVRRAAIIALDELKFYPVRLIVALLLHDSREDRSEEMSWEMIEALNIDGLSQTLNVLTKNPEEDYEKNLYNSDVITLIAKGCDRLDNLRSLKTSSLSFMVKQIKEYRNQMYLFTRMKEMSRSVYQKDVTSLLYDKIDKELCSVEEYIKAWQFFGLKT